jgi:hypothetical protein
MGLAKGVWFGKESSFKFAENFQVVQARSLRSLNELFSLKDG